MELRRLDQRSGNGEESPDDWDWGEVQRTCKRIAYRYARHDLEAEDLAQAAVLRAWQRRDSLRDRRKRRPWLATIVRNEALGEFKKVRPSPVDMFEVQEGADDERVIATVEQADLHAALGRLNERDRQLVRLRYDEDMTQVAIARRLGIPVGTVKVRLHRVRAKLRRAIGTI